MDNLPQLYYDVRIATVQLEYLLEIARAALQPWPKRDSRGRVHAQSKQTANEITESQLIYNKEDDEQSVKLLDEILIKAQTVRELSKGQRKVNTAKPLLPYMETSATRSAVQRNARKPAGKVGRAHSATRAVGGAQSMETQPEMSDQFTVEKHGNKMILPSKWSRGRAAIDNYADHKMESMIKMDGQHFVQLLQQQGGSDHYVNKCLILRATIEAVMDDIASIPVADWNINSRNGWQELYRVQRHVDLIKQSMVALRQGMDDVPRTGVLSDPMKHQSPHRLTYSSIKELLDYVDSNTTLQLRQYQLRVSQLCQSHLVPVVWDATSDAVMTANIRNIYNLLGLKCLPVLVHMSDNK